jgi:hypothetical protein
MLVALAAVAILASDRLTAATATSPATAKQRSGLLLLPPAAPAGQIVLYGHIRKLTRKGPRVELRFDPAVLTSGATARRAKLEDTGSSEVPNDNYTVEEGHRLLTYLVAANARITVLTNHGPDGISATLISTSELARIVNGGKHRKLFEPLDSGVWIRVRIDTVQELDQQYKP